jgi:hypothetical protein
MKSTQTLPSQLLAETSHQIFMFEKLRWKINPPFMKKAPLNCESKWGVPEPGRPFQPISGNKHLI